ncbi:MAG: endonuclease domain-containing protein [Firmicutes bacterium]|nr:endonuclease domain-containing protein [Bacillota bacterium]
MKTEMQNNKNSDLPCNIELKKLASELRKAGNLSEALLWLQIKNRKLKGLCFDRQKVIGNYIVDFYCADKRVVIEIDGTTHDYKYEYDKERDEYLKSFGLKVVHILDIDVKQNLAGVMQFLEENI